MDMARSLGHVDGGQEEALEALCRAAQAELAGRLRPEVRSEDFTAGEVTIQEGDGAARAAALRLQAETVLGPWLADRGFAFQGVPG